MIRVDALLFRAAAECQSTEETRYYLNGVYVHAHPEKGALLVATDGHRLLIAHDEAGACSKPGIVAIDKSIFANKSFEANKPDARITVDADGIASVGTYRGTKSALIDGTFPDYATVVRPVLALAKAGKRAAATFSHAYIAAFCKIAALLKTGDKFAPMRLVSFTENDPALIRFGSTDNVFGILMPMRSIISNEIPLFMKPVLEPAKLPAPTARRPTQKAKATKKPIRKTAKRRAA